MTFLPRITGRRSLRKNVTDLPDSDVSPACALEEFVADDRNRQNQKKSVRRVPPKSLKQAF